jgi:hypothetical protein
MIIVAEFVFGMLGCTTLGVWALTWGGAAGLVLGIWLLGLGANYLVLTWHIAPLWRRERLQAELVGADLHAELRQYTREQFWVLVPFWVAGLAVVQAGRNS